MIFCPRARSFFGLSASRQQQRHLADHRIDHPAQEFDVLEIELALALQRRQRRGEQGHRMGFLDLAVARIAEHRRRFLDHDARIGRFEADVEIGVDALGQAVPHLALRLRSRS